MSRMLRRDVMSKREQKSKGKLEQESRIDRDGTASRDNPNSQSSHSRRKFLSNIGGITVAGIVAGKLGLPAIMGSVTTPTEGKPMRNEVVKFFTENDKALNAAKIEAQTGLANRQGWTAVKAARQAQLPIGEALDRVVNQYETHLADDYTFIDPYGEVIDKPVYLQQLRSGHAIFDDLTRSQHNIRLYGENAVMTCLVTVTGVLGGRDITGRYSETHTLRRQGESWQLLASQSTLAQPMKVLFPIKVDERLAR